MKVSKLRLIFVASPLIQLLSSSISATIRYAAPDVLATLSASFMKDHKKPAFNDQSLRSTTFQASFASASSVAQSLSLLPHPQPVSSSYIPQHEGNASESQIAESSRKGYSSRPATTPSARQLDLGHIWLSSNHCRSGALTAESEACFARTPRSDYPQPHHIITAGSKSPSYLPNADPTQKFARPLLHSSSLNRSTDISSTQSAFLPQEERIQSSQKKENGPKSALAPDTQGSGKLAVGTQVYGQQSIGSNSSRPRPHESCTPRPGYLRGPTAEILSDGSPGMSGTAIMREHWPRRGVNSNVKIGFEGTKIALAAQEQTALNEADSSHAMINQATTQTAVKRRLGMGRTTTGYSNKKFKRPV